MSKAPHHTKSGPGRKHSTGKGTLGHGVMKGVTHAPHWTKNGKAHFRARLLLEMQRAGYKFVAA